MVIKITILSPKLTAKAPKSRPFGLSLPPFFQEQHVSFQYSGGVIEHMKESWRIFVPQWSLDLEKSRSLRSSFGRVSQREGLFLPRKILCWKGECRRSNGYIYLNNWFQSNAAVCVCVCVCFWKIFLQRHVFWVRLAKHERIQNAHEYLLIVWKDDCF